MSQERYGIRRFTGCHSSPSCGALYPPCAGSAAHLVLARPLCLLAHLPGHLLQTSGHPHPAGGPLSFVPFWASSSVPYLFIRPSSSSAILVLRGAEQYGMGVLFCTVPVSFGLLPLLQYLYCEEPNGTVYKCVIVCLRHACT